MPIANLLFSAGASALLVLGGFAAAQNAARSARQDAAEAAASTAGNDAAAEVFTPAKAPSPEKPIGRPGETAAHASGDMAAVLGKLDELGVRNVWRLTPEEARGQPTLADAAAALLEERRADAAAEEVAGTEDLEVPGAGGKLAARIYRPKLEEETESLLPVIAYWHGGGWVTGGLDAFDASARALANGAGAIVVSFGYRLAPEHPFPAAHEDAWAAWQWLARNASKYGGDAARIAVAGEGAGGNLAANVAIRARNEGSALPVHQLLVHPVAGTDLQTPSYIENQATVPLGRSAMAWSLGHALGDRGADPRIALVRADLSDLPPSTVITAELDPLRWEGRTLARRIAAEGVETTSQTYPGVTHGFFGLGAVLGEARQAQDLAANNLRRAFQKPRPQAPVHALEEPADGKRMAFDAESFDALDRDASGTLEEDEWMAAVARVAVLSDKEGRRLFHSVARGDKQITQREFMAAEATAARAFSKPLRSPGGR